MVQRYCNIWRHLPENWSSREQDTLLWEEKISDTNALLIRLIDLVFISVELQSDRTTVVHSRDLFDGVSEKYSSMKDRLDDKASMVLNSHFEEAIRKFQRREEPGVKGVQQWATQHLREKRTGNGTPKMLSTPMSFAKILLKKSMNCTNCSKSKYVNTRFITLTPNLCEPIFLIVGYTLSNWRRVVYSCNFEMQLFLLFKSWL